jgi:hypothetical protein
MEGSRQDRKRKFQVIRTPILYRFAMIIVHDVRNEHFISFDREEERRYSRVVYLIMSSSFFFGARIGSEL